MRNIDMNSLEFKTELEKTTTFVDKVYKQFNFYPNPNEEVNEGVRMGLARNKLIYGKRYCPCFMVIGETKEEQIKADNRICPCKPALEEEIPKDGLCHCGIFCSEEYVIAQKSKEEVIEEEIKHSKGLTQDQAELLLGTPQLQGEELEALLEARELNMIDFILVDTRELMEFQMGHIIGTDKLVPTSQFYNKVEAELGDKKEENIILYCHSGSRSYQVQQAMKSMGYKHLGNLQSGIISFTGKTQKG